MTVGLRLERHEVVGGWVCVCVCVVKTEGDVKKMGGNFGVLFVCFDTHTPFFCSSGLQAILFFVILIFVYYNILSLSAYSNQYCFGVSFSKIKNKQNQFKKIKRAGCIQNLPLF